MRSKNAYFAFYFPFPTKFRGTFLAHHCCPLMSRFIFLFDWHICPLGTITALPSFLISDALLDERRLRWPHAPQQTPSILMKTDEVLGSPCLSALT